jgi:hypothetical protein
MLLLLLPLEAITQREKREERRERERDREHEVGKKAGGGAET